jgi:putative transposase
LKLDRRRLFVIDGSKALRKAIDQVFGQQHPVQRCRNHKLQNVLGHLPKDQHDQAKATLRAAWRLEADEGMAKIQQYASWLENDWPSAARSLREGLSETFTINRLGLPGSAVLGVLCGSLPSPACAPIRAGRWRDRRWLLGARPQGLPGAGQSTLGDLPRRLSAAGAQGLAE